MFYKDSVFFIFYGYKHNCYLLTQITLFTKNIKYIKIYI